MPIKQHIAERHLVNFATMGGSELAAVSFRATSGE